MFDWREKRSLLKRRSEIMNSQRKMQFFSIALIVLCFFLSGCAGNAQQAAPAINMNSETEAMKEKAQEVPSDEDVSKTTGLRKVSAMASYIVYPNVDELDREAQLILIGTPTQNFIDRTSNNVYYEDGNLQDNSTVTDFKIERVIKNQDNIELGEEIPIIEPISIIEEADGQKVVATIEDYVELQKGKKYVVFLHKNTYGQYSVINMNNGRFAIEEGSDLERSVMADSNKEEHSEFKEQVLQKYKLNP